jgi:hypothetical protein
MPTGWSTPLADGTPRRARAPYIVAGALCGLALLAALPLLSAAGRGPAAAA